MSSEPIRWHLLLEDAVRLIEAFLTAQRERPGESTLQKRGISVEIIRADRRSALCIHNFKPDALRDPGIRGMLLIECKRLKCFRNVSCVGVHLASMIGKGEDATVSQGKSGITCWIIGEDTACQSDIELCFLYPSALSQSAGA